MFYIVVGFVALVLGAFVGHSQTWKHSQTLIRVIRGCHANEMEKAHTVSYSQGWSDCEKVMIRSAKIKSQSGKLKIQNSSE